MSEWVRSLRFIAKMVAALIAAFLVGTVLSWLLEAAWSLLSGTPLPQGVGALASIAGAAAFIYYGFFRRSRRIGGAVSVEPEQGLAPLAAPGGDSTPAAQAAGRNRPRPWQVLGGLLILMLLLVSGALALRVENLSTKQHLALKEYKQEVGAAFDEFRSAAPILPPPPSSLQTVEETVSYLTKLSAACLSRAKVTTPLVATLKSVTPTDSATKNHQILIQKHEEMADALRSLGEGAAYVAGFLASYQEFAAQDDKYGSKALSMLADGNTPPDSTTIDAYRAWSAVWSSWHDRLLAMRPPAEMLPAHQAVVTMVEPWSESFDDAGKIMDEIQSAGDSPTREQYERLTATWARLEAARPADLDGAIQDLDTAWRTMTTDLPQRLERLEADAEQAYRELGQL